MPASSRRTSHRNPFPLHVDVHRLKREAPYGGGGGGGGDANNAGENGSRGGGEDGGGEGTNPAPTVAAAAATALGVARRQRKFTERVRHYLGRLQVLQRPKVNRLFHHSAVDAKSLKAHPVMR